jgi:hypothetical protein
MKPADASREILKQLFIPGELNQNVPSAARVATGFLTLIQVVDGPDRRGISKRVVPFRSPLAFAFSRAEFLLQQRAPEREEPMRYKARSVAALDIVLGDLPDHMRVEVDPDIEVRAKTVGELRKVKAWPENLAVVIPHDHGPGSTVKVSKANVATRMSPKS